MLSISTGLARRLNERETPAMTAGRIASKERAMRYRGAKTVAFWTTTILGPASFVIGGVLHVTQSEEVVATLHHLGYPAYFALLLGAWKLAGAIVIAAPGLPRLKEWAYAGFAFDLTAAAASRAAVGDSAGDIIAPLVFLALVLASWALRPASRMLAAPSVPNAAPLRRAA
jgi:uncharacterized membrane protein YphA (DoxX/SURF4 family)